MPIYQLIIAHLLGDFVFQPNSLIKWKHESWMGTFVHTLVIGFFSSILILPYLNSAKAFLMLFLLFLSHFVQDILKIIYQSRKNAKASILPFFVDQCFHLYFIWLFAGQFAKLGHFKLPEKFSEIYFSTNLMVFVILGIFVTFALDIIFFEAHRVQKRNSKYHRDYCSMVYRLIGFLVVYALLAFGK